MKIFSGIVITQLLYFMKYPFGLWLLISDVDDEVISNILSFISLFIAGDQRDSWPVL